MNARYRTQRWVEAHRVGGCGAAPSRASFPRAAAARAPDPARRPLARRRCQLRSGRDACARWRLARDGTGGWRVVAPQRTCAGLAAAGGGGTAGCKSGLSRSASTSAVARACCKCRCQLRRSASLATPPPFGSASSHHGRQHEVAVSCLLWTMHCNQASEIMQSTTVYVNSLTLSLSLL